MKNQIVIDLDSIRSAKGKAKVNLYADIVFMLKQAETVKKECEGFLKEHFNNEPGDYAFEGGLITISKRSGHMSFKDSKELIMTYVPEEIQAKHSYVTADSISVKVRKGK